MLIISLFLNLTRQAIQCRSYSTRTNVWRTQTLPLPYLIFPKHDNDYFHEENPHLARCFDQAEVFDQTEHDYPFNKTKLVCNNIRYQVRLLYTYTLLAVTRSAHLHFTMNSENRSTGYFRGTG
jgi:hypothetical protein